MELIILINGQEFGPYTEEEVLAKVDDGTLSESDLAMVEGKTDWLPLASFIVREPVEDAATQDETPLVDSKPKPIPESSSTKWHYADSNKQAVGPFATEDLLKLRSAGIVQDQTLVFEEGGSEWRPIAAIWPTLTTPPVAEPVANPGWSPPPIPRTVSAAPPTRSGDVEPTVAATAQTISPPLQSHSWYYSQDGKRIGPVNSEQIRNLTTANTIRRDSLIWREGMPGWMPAYQTEIQQLFTSTTTPPPLPGEGPTTSANPRPQTDRLGSIIMLAPTASAILIVFGFPRLGIMAATVFCTSALMAVEASQLGMKQGKKKTGPLVWFVGGISLWAIAFPMYLYERKKWGVKNHLLGGLISMVVFILAHGSTGAGVDPQKDQLQPSSVERHEEQRGAAGVYEYTGPLLFNGFPVSDSGIPRELTIKWDLHTDNAFVFEKNTGYGPIAPPGMGDIKATGSWRQESGEVIIIEGGKETLRMKQDGADLIGKDGTRFIRVR